MNVLACSICLKNTTLTLSTCEQCAEQGMVIFCSLKVAFTRLPLATVQVMANKLLGSEKVLVRLHSTLIDPLTPE